MVKPISDRDGDIPIVSIVGRPNVGKSTLFNRILKQRVAIVHEEPGVTRDRISAVSDWFGKSFFLVDTAGLGFFTKERLSNDMDGLIRKQLDIAIKDAHKICLVVDAISGILPLDREISDLLRVNGKDVVIAANKADNEMLARSSVEFSELGFENIIPISCVHNQNIDGLLDEITANFSPNLEGDENLSPNLKIAIVGRPNVGKSSIVNQFLDEDRVIVSEIAGTTRDAIDLPVNIEVDNKNVKLDLIDTAGMRLNRNIKSRVEYFSLVRSKKAIKRADIVLVVLDGTKSVKTLDKKICRFVVDQKKPCVLLANKWDLACKKLNQKELLDNMKDSLHFLADSPIMTCCALSGYNFKMIVRQILDFQKRLQLRIPTSVVNIAINDIFARYQPACRGLRSFKVFYGVHTRNAPPTFLLFVNKVEACSANDLINIKRKMRDALGLSGLPIDILLRERQNSNRN